MPWVVGLRPPSPSARRGAGRYIIGESYAGVYVPTLVRALRADPAFPGKLKGFAVAESARAHSY